MSGNRRKGTDGLPFSKVLKRIVSERGLTVRALAEMAGTNASVVQSWISGANPHDLQAVSRLAKALDIGFKTLLLDEIEAEIEADPLSFFDEEKFFEGVCKVSITKLKSRKK